MSLSYYNQAPAEQIGVGTTAGNAGQLMSISGTIGGLTESAAYTYDDLGRLVTSNQTSNGATAQRRFGYDQWGNRTGEWDATSGGNQIQSVVLQQSGGAPTNQLTSVTIAGVTKNYTYDVAGNVTNDGVHSYTYDAENRLVSVDGGATAQYRYDHQNRRVTKIVGAAWTHYIWEGSHVIGEHDGTTPFGPYGSTPYGERSSRVDYVYAGSKLVSSLSYTHSCTTGFAGAITCTTSYTQSYYLSDRLSTRLVLDASGNVIGRQGHLPFGEDFGESGSQEKHHFTSYERDGESGADYAVNRQYSQSVGRFSRPDPFSGSINFGVPQSLNRYSYVGSDPINGLDPLGLDSCGYVSVFIPGKNGDKGHFDWVWLCVPASGGGGPFPGPTPSGLPGGPPSCAASVNTSDSAPASPDKPWRVYKCTRPLGHPGSAEACNSYFCHAYLCMAHDGKMTCVGLNPSGSKWGSQGINNDADVYHPENCKEVASDSCMGECVLSKFEKLPKYSIQGTECQVWASDVLEKCLKKCTS